MSSMLLHVISSFQTAARIYSGLINKLKLPSLKGKLSMNMICPILMEMEHQMESTEGLRHNCAPRSCRAQAELAPLSR